jgi:putative DNA primase/helicase
VLDTVIHLIRPKDYQPQEGARFEIHFEKYRGMHGDTVKPFEAQLEVHDNRTQWSMRDIEDVQLAQAAALFATGLSVRDVAQELEISKSAAQRLRSKIPPKDRPHD